MRHEYDHCNLAQLCKSSKPSSRIGKDHYSWNDLILSVLVITVPLHADPYTQAGHDVLGEDCSGTSNCAGDGDMDLLES